jgi:hypothetical protein
MARDPNKRVPPRSACNSLPVPVRGDTLCNRNGLSRSFLGVYAVVRIHRLPIYMVDPFSMGHMRRPSAKGTPLFVQRLLVDRPCLVRLLTCALEYRCKFRNMDDVKGDAVPARTVFAVFVRPPRSKGTDVAATKPFESDLNALGLAASPLRDDDCLFLLFEHDMTPIATASSEQCPATSPHESRQ